MTPAPVAVASGPGELPEPGDHRSSPLHGPDRIWTETNCYADLWIELLHALGCEPLAVAGFTLAADFDGRQWSFFKPPLEDIRALYGIDVAEMNVWRPVIDHVEEELASGRFVSVEVDAWYLPDTAGVSHHLAHTKTTIVPGRLDRAGRRLDYFHGAGFHRVHGDDFDGLFAPPLLPPYTELIRLDDLHRDPDAQVEISRRLAAAHLGRRPAANPVAAMARHLEDRLDWLRQADAETFHQFAFGTCRQCGAEAELAATYLRWLGGAAGLDLDTAADRLDAVAEGAKTLQFALARAARGRSVDIPVLAAPLAEAWQDALDRASAQLGGA